MWEPSHQLRQQFYLSEMWRCPLPWLGSGLMSYFALQPNSSEAGQAESLSSTHFVAAMTFNGWERIEGWQ